MDPFHRLRAPALAVLAVAVVALLATACEAEYGVDEEALILADNPNDPTVGEEGAGNPFDPQVGGNPFAPSAGPTGGGPEGVAHNPYDPAHYGSGDDEEGGGFLPGLGGGLQDYLCNCLEPGGFVPTVSFHACASNPFEAANFSVNKVQCIFVNGCTGCVCFPGLPCLIKG